MSSGTMLRGRRVEVLVGAAVMLVLAMGASHAVAANPAASPDFNNDGFADLPTTVCRVTETPDPVRPPEIPVVGRDTQTWVALRFGGATPNIYLGLSVQDNNTAGCGSLAFASGDFDGDAYDDLVVGDPWRKAAHIGFGRDSISNRGFRDSKRIAFGAGLFGESVAVGDFNADGRDDLAVGAPWDPHERSGVKEGEVHVLYGPAFTRSQRWHQGSPGIAGAPNWHDRFGTSLAAGDFNGDGTDDLAIGVPGETFPGRLTAGVVHVIYGQPLTDLRAGGLSSDGSQLWHQNSAGIRGKVEFEDEFGSSLASGDFNDDTIDDLAVGVVGETVTGLIDAGAVNVIYGRSPGGLNKVGNQLWSQASRGVNGKAETSDGFGTTLAVGDFNGPGPDDLAVGVPLEDLSDARFNAGAVNVIYGATSGLSSTGNQVWTQDSPGVALKAGARDHFGKKLAVGDVNGDAFDDLAIQVTDRITAGSFSGMLNRTHVVLGAQKRLTSDGSFVWP